ncbi:MAG: hypothetical protein HC888_00495 [Candidatus Competibacteraceae bacterium]|nr:hypothetical protein [Candidatus Competibacteraceae bacterium]
MDNARSQVSIREFPGISNAIDDFDTLPGTAVTQTNFQSEKDGLLEVRPGYVEVTFED